MQFVPITCPNCVSLQVFESNLDSAFCPNCGIKIYVKFEAWKQHSASYNAQGLSDIAEKSENKSKIPQTVPITCPNCMTLQVFDPERNYAFCSNCGTKIPVKIEAEKQRSTNYSAQELSDISEMKLAQETKFKIRPQPMPVSHNQNQSDSFNMGMFLVGILLNAIAIFALGLIIGIVVYVVGAIVTYVYQKNEWSTEYIVGGIIGLIIGFGLLLAFTAAVVKSVLGLMAY